MDLLCQPDVMAKKLVSIDAFRQYKKAQEEEGLYRNYVACLDKLELLNEMVRFQEERSKIGHLTPLLMVRGRILFAALEKNAETETLRMLSRSYKRHLEYELADFLERRRKSS